MAVLFESFGNFITGISSYGALISKRSRGTIILTESSFSFKSEKDKILYEIKVSSIQNFYFVKRFRLFTIELISDQGVLYTFYPRNKKNKRFSCSQILTTELFRSLVRVVYKKNFPILFETKAGIIESEFNEAYDFFQEKIHYGIIILTEENIIFKAYEEYPTISFHILESNDIILHSNNSKVYTELKLAGKKSVSIFALKNKSSRNRKDKAKTIKLHEFLIQVKEYKISERLQEKEEEENRIEQLKAMFEVSNKVRLEMIRNALDMDEKSFTNKIFDWAKQFKFIIDGDYLIVNLDTIAEFIDNLKTGFDLSIRQGMKKNCLNCGKTIDYTAKICPYCGTEQ